MKRKRTGSSRYFVFFFFAVCLLILLYFGFQALFTKLDWFRIESVVVQGNQNLESEFLQNLSLDFIGQNLYAVRKEDIKMKYENIVRIKDIGITKVFPNKIKIFIEERKGLFNIKTTDGEIFPIDTEMVVLDNDNFYPDEVLPVIVTALPTDAIQFGQKAEDPFLKHVYDFYAQVAPQFPDLFQDISEIYEKNGDIFLVEASVGYKIVFGDEEIIDKVKRYEFLEQNRSFEKGKVIDLRYKDQLVIRAEE
ncbi:MAG TPA: FtsQ-type POTRA domain-containing protein [Candidatus Cloacimonadota bacterium]|nr:FtsQ-type POTRA domain-containing protein [Candidatus Cloacimonadota bacterium]